MPKFTVSGEQIRARRRGVTIAGDLIRYLAGLAKGLNELGLLYQGREVPAPRQRDQRSV